MIRLAVFDGAADDPQAVEIGVYEFIVAPRSGDHVVLYDDDGRAWTFQVTCLQHVPRPAEGVSILESRVAIYTTPVHPTPDEVAKADGARVEAR